MLLRTILPASAALLLAGPALGTTPVKPKVHPSADAHSGLRQTVIPQSEFKSVRDPEVPPDKESATAEAKPPEGRLTPAEREQIRRFVAEEINRARSEGRITDKDLRKMQQLVERLKEPDENTLIQLCLLLVTIVGASLGLREYHKRTKQRRLKVRRSFDSEFTQILTSLYDEENETYFTYERKRETYISYFDLCSREYWAFKEGCIDEDIWKDWESGIKSLMLIKQFRDVWAQINKQAQRISWYGPGFIQFIDECVAAPSPDESAD